MTLRFILATAVVVCGVPEVVAAQAADTLDLRRAVALARSANPMLAARAAEVRTASSRIRPAGAWPDPALTIGAMN